MSRKIVESDPPCRGASTPGPGLWPVPQRLFASLRKQEVNGEAVVCFRLDCTDVEAHPVAPGLKRRMVRIPSAAVIVRWIHLKVGRSLVSESPSTN